VGPGLQHRPKDTSRQPLQASENSYVTNEKDLTRNELLHDSRTYVRSAPPARRSQQGLKMIPRIVPLGRPGRAQGSRKSGRILASDEGSYITGIELFVDGGVAQV
jgi:NAD(P)-dependent dehydrogenase (short-subunit alcohol dehydrogenase family)